MNRKESHIIELVEYTDTYCTWCWGSEPILRKIKVQYGDQVKVSFKMGGLVEDASTFFDPVNRIGGENMFEQVAAHWLEASSRHGMPVDPQGILNMANEFRSTYQANIAYKAAQMQDEQLANNYLRRMREAAAAEARLLHRIDVQVELAQEVGLDQKKFLKTLKDGSAEKAFHEELKETRALGITGFPTFHIKNNQDEGKFLRGYQHFEKFETIFKELTKDKLVKKKLEPSTESILKFINEYKKVATQEVTEVFDLSLQKTENHLTSLESNGKIKKVKAGNGHFWISIDIISKN